MAADPPGAGAPSMVAMKVVQRIGPLTLVENPQGSRFWLVVCVHCQSDLSRVSHGRMLMGPQGPVPDVYHPLRCPDCGGGLMPMPVVVAAPRGAAVPRQ